jgi:hypothetical protein
MLVLPGTELASGCARCAGGVHTVLVHKVFVQQVAWNK